MYGCVVRYYTRRVATREWWGMGGDERWSITTNSHAPRQPAHARQSPNDTPTKPGLQGTSRLCQKETSTHWRNKYTLWLVSHVIRPRLLAKLGNHFCLLSLAHSLLSSSASLLFFLLAVSLLRLSSRPSSASSPLSTSPALVPSAGSVLSFGTSYL